MKLKALFGALALFLASFLPAFAATPAATPFDDKAFSVSTFATYQANATAPKDGRLGAGLAVEYNFSRYVAVQASTFRNDWGANSVFQNLALSPILRIPILDWKVAPYVIGSAGFDFDQDNARFYSAGVGLDWRATRKVGAFADVQQYWRQKSEDNLGVRLGLRYTF